MAATRRDALAVIGVSVLGLALGACSGEARPEATGSDAASPPKPAPAAPSPTSSVVPSVSAGAQALSAASIAPGALVPCIVKRVQPLLVLVTADGRQGAIYGSAYEKVKVGDHVIVRITDPNRNGRFEGTLVHVSGKS